MASKCFDYKRVINIAKLRKTTNVQYVFKKFRRLLLKIWISESVAVLNETYDLN
jgi:hypothetical protein